MVHLNNQEWCQLLLFVTSRTNVPEPLYHYLHQDMMMTKKKIKNRLLSDWNPATCFFPPIKRRNLPERQQELTDESANCSCPHRPDNLTVTTVAQSDN